MWSARPLRHAPAPSPASVLRGLVSGAVLLLAACAPTAGDDDDAPLAEGRSPGDCADGADNDGDGAFDCDDSGCAGSPDCDGEDPEPLDCDAVPDAPVADSEVLGARGYHGLAFDDAGRMVGSDNLSLLRTDRTGNVEVFVPGLGVLQQMAYLPDGDLLVSRDEDGALLRVNPEGGMSVLVPDLHAYSVLVDPRGRVWTASTLGGPDPAIRRTDPATGATVEVARLPDDAVGARALQFDRTASTLYIANAGGRDSGAVYRVALDAGGDPVGDAELWVEGVGGGWLDGIAVDRCGSLYVPDSWTLTLYRITADGEVSAYADWSADESDYGHAAVFGTGLDGWRDDALYLPLPYGRNRVKELVIGVPSSAWEGRVIGEP